MPKVLSEDNINRFRITHPDKDLRPLLRRIHQLPKLHSYIAAGIDNDADLQAKERVEADRAEVEMTRIELMKWKATMERILASARNLDRQAEKYKSKAEDTARQSEELHQTLEKEKEHLRSRLAERGRQVQCDEVYAKIVARPAQKADLEDQIAQLKSQIASHAATHARYLSTAQKRAELLSTIAPIMEQVRAMRLPIETVSAEEEAIAAETPDAGAGAAADGGMDVDEPSTGSSRTQLSAAAAPFQPGSGSASTGTASNAPASRSKNGRATSSPQPPSGPMPPNQRAASYALPTRPSSSRQPSASMGGASTQQPKHGTRALSADATIGPSGKGGMTSTTARSLPSRPKSGLRNSATPGREEGEVDGQEEGEVDDKDKGRRPRGGRNRR